MAMISKKQIATIILFQFKNLRNKKANLYFNLFSLRYTLAASWVQKAKVSNRLQSFRLSEGKKEHLRASDQGKNKTPLLSFSR